MLGNIALALRFADGMSDRMPALAAELVALKPDVMIAAPESSLAAVRGVTRTIPVITVWLQDPVLSGAADTIARLGGTICLFQIFEILTPALFARRTGRSRIVSRCGKARFRP